MGGARVGVGVPAGDGDAARDQQVDQLERAGQLRRQGDLSDRPCHHKLLEGLEVGGSERAPIVSTGFGRREERSLEMDADHRRSTLHLPHPPDRVDHRLDARR
jgi:hypothetical protein